MHAINARLAGALIAIAAASVLAATAACAQQFTMKLSQPTINDVVHEYYKALKAGPDKLKGAIERAKRATADGRPYLLDIHTYRDGVGAASSWHPPYSVADLRQRKV